MLSHLLLCLSAYFSLSFNELVVPCARWVLLGWVQLCSTMLGHKRDQCQLLSERATWRTCKLSVPVAAGSRLLPDVCIDVCVHMCVYQGCVRPTIDVLLPWSLYVQMHEESPCWVRAAGAPVSVSGPQDLLTEACVWLWHSLQSCVD